ncbi:glycosyltransferase [Paraoerskovia sediminicola]|uniref:glycosyltransferase n=1 Tax=Paraoerskovia sediminicola TaxID=1138587 RepID=UPI0025744AEA|nr:glycosyltransferase [Paraoerskovia sediminicola]
MTENRATTPERIGAAAVVIPVHDEEELLPQCLASVEQAVAAAVRERPGLAVVTVVVLDACTDGSAAVPGPEVTVMEVDARTVGVARHLGVDRALAELRGVGVGADRTWIACTDADSVVPPDWLTHHLDLADAGAHVVVGAVRPPLDDLSPDRAAAWRQRFVPGLATGHVHGANLGVRSDVYAAVGGYAPVEEHEDVGLVERVRALGHRVVPTADAWVLTSARLHGRTPGGYARYLREDLGRVAG